MGDPEANSLQKTSTMKAISSRSYGCSFTYLFSIPGLFRVINIASFSKNFKILEKSDFFLHQALGAVAFGLWLPGYEHEFLGDRINLITGDTERGQFL